MASVATAEPPQPETLDDLVRQALAASERMSRKNPHRVLLLKLTASAVEMAKKCHHLEQV